MLKTPLLALVSVVALLVAHASAGPVPQADEHESETFVQYLDHTLGYSNGEWNMRIWRNAAYWKKNGPIFLRIGSNEAETADGIFAESAPIVQLAKEHGALIFNMEMRFFGDSHPTYTTRMASLDYLTAEQSLGDVTRFINETNWQLNLDSARWVLFGTAYGGNIALWHRQSRPELTVGAWASSASVGAVFDYSNFAASLKSIYGAYSAACAQNIENGFAQLHEMAQTAEGRAELDKAFLFSPALSSLEQTPTHQQNAFHVLIGHFLIAAQFSNVHKAPFTKKINVAGVCAEMERPAFNDVARIVNWVKVLQNAVFGKFESLNINYDLVMKLFQIPLFQSPVREKRLQTWQNCQEIGQMPSSSTEGVIFGRIVPVDYFLGICRDVFGKEFTREYVEGKMEKTMKTYGRPEEYKGQRVIASQGANDPMRDLGLKPTQTNEAAGVLVRWIDGEASGADLMPTETGPYSDEMRAFHQEASDAIKSWLGN